MIGLIGFLTAVAIAVAIVAIPYNRLVTLRNRFKNAFAQIDVQLQRRYDLIPNLVEAAKGYLKHERETLEAVISARNQAAAARQQAAANPGDAAALTSVFSADNGLTTMLGRLFAVVEAYPDLKADASMRQLSEELVSTENRVAFARQAYNDAVMRYNTASEQFPVNIIASLFNFSSAPFFETQDGAVRQAPQVSFS